MSVLKLRFSWWPVLICLGLLVPVVGANAQERFGITFSYDEYSRALAEYVDDNGMVDYAGLQNNRANIDGFVRDVAGLYINLYDGWPELKKLAYWINAYNGITLRVVVDHYPIQPALTAKLAGYPIGIRHIPGVWTEATHMAKGSMISLDEIEHEILRKQFNEPRIHMALVCAAKGCPPLRNEPYTADNLDEQLADQSRKFLGDPLKFRIDSKASTVYLSKIFKWYGEDFEKDYAEAPSVPWAEGTEKAVLAFIGKYIPASDWQALQAGSYKIEYLDYDWSLNEQ